VARFRKKTPCVVFTHLEVLPIASLQRRAYDGRHIGGWSRAELLYEKVYRLLVLEVEGVHKTGRRMFAQKHREMKQGRQQQRRHREEGFSSEGPQARLRGGRFKRSNSSHPPARAAVVFFSPRSRLEEEILLHACGAKSYAEVLEISAWYEKAMIPRK